MVGAIPWVPIYCANCGADGGWIPEAAKDEDCFYLCIANGCFDKWTPIQGTFVVSDEVYWQHCKNVMLEEYGRELTGNEVIEALKDPTHILSKLAKDRPNFRKKRPS